MSRLLPIFEPPENHDMQSLANLRLSRLHRRRFGWPRDSASIQNKAKASALIFLIPTVFTCALHADIHASQIDARNSTLRVISRSGEPNAPVMGERLQCEITLRDAQNNPIGGFPGDQITLFSREQGVLHTRQLEGRTCRETGRLYAAFEPHDRANQAAIRVAVKIGDKILNSMPRVTFNQAGELVDQCQPLWSGTQEVSGRQTIGQVFKVGDIKHITRIKAMLKAGTRGAQPMLTLYEWQGDYNTTKSAPPLVVIRDFSQHPRELLATFRMDTPVKPRKMYYCELAHDDTSIHNDDNETLRVWRVFSGSHSAYPADAYPAGPALWNGRERPEWNLMFFVFTRKE